MIIVGGVLSPGGSLSTVTAMGLRGASFPARSTKTTLMVCSVSSSSNVVSQE